MTRPRIYGPRRQMAIRLPVSTITAVHQAAAAQRVGVNKFLADAVQAALDDIEFSPALDEVTAS